MFTPLVYKSHACETKLPLYSAILRSGSSYNTTKDISFKGTCKNNMVLTDEGIKEFFDSNSETYETSYLDGTKPYWNVKCQYIDNNFNDIQLLDIGCGSGGFLRHCNQRVDVDELVGIDISGGMLPEEPQNDIAYFKASAPDLPFSPNSFDVINLTSVLHHMVGGSRADSKKRARETLSRTFDLLRPGGLLLLTELFYEGHVIPQSTSWILFQMFKHFPNLSAKLDPSAAPGLVTNFYTRDELRALIEETGGHTIHKDYTKWEKSTFLRTCFIKNYGKIHFYIKKLGQ